MLVLILIILAIIYAIFIYNKIIRLKEDAVNAENEISVWLDRRSKVFDSLISVVKESMKFENETFSKIVKLRSIEKSMGSELSESRIQAEEELSKLISSGAVASAINLTVEAYPDLKSTENLKHLQEEIISTENKLAYSKKAYNDAIEAYNVAIKSIPEKFIVDFAKDSLYKEFKYWKISDEDIKSAEERRVEF